MTAQDTECTGAVPRRLRVVLDLMAEDDDLRQRQGEAEEHHPRGLAKVRRDTRVSDGGR